MTKLQYWRYKRLLADQPIGTGTGLALLHPRTHHSLRILNKQILQLKSHCILQSYQFQLILHYLLLVLQATLSNFPRILLWKNIIAPPVKVKLNFF